jgi:hypothetical protein
MRRLFSINSFLLTLLFLMGLADHLFAQQQYTIDISNQQYALKSGFLKMGTNVSPSGEALSYNDRYLTKNNKPWFPIMGEMHFSQNDEKDWENSILKMKAGGLEIIAVYMFWIHHEETKGVMDWSGNRDFQKFLSLCKKHDMYVWLRPGPWIHAEARNGGFPDWLQNLPIKLRTDDSTYLAYSKKWFADVAKQCEGYWYKQNGTIIGVQIENELEFKVEAVYQHMKTLKRLAIEVGIDVPYYSAFSQGPDNQHEFLYTMGGYPDSPWAQHTKKMYKSVMFIKKLEADSDIGSDLFGKVSTEVRSTYPKLGAELGSGMQKTYHRRVDVSTKDVGATILTRIASGINGLGYFMYNGGHNPIGKNNTTTESRVTGYPNDMPYVNYDFQAPIGDFGIIRESYNELRLLNLFLKDFGDEVAVAKTFFPKKMIKNAFSRDTVQSSIRVHDNSGFIFLSNYQRFVNYPEVEGFQLHLLNNGKQVNIPQKPVTFNANSYAIWPFNLPVDNAILHYATAQPLCILKNKDKNTYVFFTDADAEFVINNQTITSYTTTNCTAKKEGETTQFNIKNNTIALFDILNKYHKKTSVLVLPREKALQASKIKYQNKEVLVLSADNVLWDNKTLSIEHINDNPTATVSVYPAINLKGNTKLFTIKPIKVNAPFVGYDITANEQPKASVSIKEDTNLLNKDIAKDAVFYQDSILKYYATSKRFNKLQPGPLYQVKFHNLPEQHLYNINFNTKSTALVKDWLVDIDYTGDVMALYKNNSLLYDQFNYDNHCLYKWSSANLKPTDKLKLQVLPFKKEYDVYVEDKMKKEKEEEWTKGILKNITLKPVYVFELQFD